MTTGRINQVAIVVDQCIAWLVIALHWPPKTDEMG
jgi:hypothetical protein